MTYNTNRGYGNNVSYSFSSRSPDYVQNNFSQTGYRNSSPVIHYSASPGVALGSSSNFSYEQEGVGKGYATRAGGGLGRGRGNRGGGRGGSRGGGRGTGRGIGRGQGRGMRDSGQGCADMQNQFIAEQENNPALTEVDSAINNLNSFDLPQNQIIIQEFTQLEIKHYQKITFTKKQSKEEPLEVIIKEVELLNKKFKKNIIR